MKVAILVLSALFCLNVSAYAKANLDNQFSGKYDEFIVSYDQTTGKVKLADSHVRKVYTANVKNGQEYPLDIEFLQFSPSPTIQKYTDYLLSATVAAQLNSTGAIDFVIKAKANFDGGTEPQVVLVFSATSRVAKSVNDYDGTQYEVKTIESDLRFERIESPQGGPLSDSANLYKLLLSFIAQLWPSNGFHSTIFQGWY